MSDFDVVRDDLALDALAAGLRPEDSDETLDLLYALRTGIEPVAPVLPLPRKRSGLFVALAAAAGIVVGGVTAGAVAVADRPGELLYAAHSAILGPTDRSGARVTELLDRASGALAAGDRAGARRLLAQAEAMIPSVPEGDRAALRERLALLSGFAAEPTPSATPSPDRHGGRSPEPSPSAEPGDDHSGSGSSGSGSDDSGSGSSGSSGSGSSGSSGSGHSGSGSGSGDD